MRYLVFVVVFLCALMFTTSTVAQEVEVPEVEVTVVEGDNSIVFAGYMYDDGPFFVSGAGQDLGGGLWLFERGVTGANQTVAVDVAYLVYLSDLYSFGSFANKIFLGPIAGPEVDWINTETDDIPTLAYLNGAVGGIVGVDPFESGIFDGACFWGAYKHKFTFEDNSYDKTGWLLAAGVGWKF